MRKSSAGLPRWGDLNVALNALVRDETIVSFKTNRAEKGSETSVDVTIAAGADQAEVVSRVRAALPESFEGTIVRTRKG